MNIKEYLIAQAFNNSLEPARMQFPDTEMDVSSIKAVMISEVPPQNPEDWFYSCSREQEREPDYMKTTCSLFQRAGVEVQTIEDILNLGIYITTAVKTPKLEYTVDKDMIEAHLPMLEAELSLFPNVKVIMLMGDVAKKSVNMIGKAKSRKNIIPSEATYKIRKNEYYWNNIRVMPSYIMTGGNILIEKSKCKMIVEDIRQMMQLIGK